MHRACSRLWEGLHERTQPILGFFFFFKTTELLISLWEHRCSLEISQGLAASHSLWSSPCPCEAGRQALRAPRWNRQFPGLSGLSHRVWVGAGPEPHLLTLDQMGKTSAVPRLLKDHFPEGWGNTFPLSCVQGQWRGPGVQRSARRTLSSSTSPKARRGRGLCPPLSTTPEQRLSNSRSNYVYKISIHSSAFQLLSVV